MPNRYLFGNCKSESVLNSAALVEDGVTWDHQVQEPTIYTTEEDETEMENNNETYMTANDGHDDTQYFSILESTSDLTLNNLSNVYALEDDTLQEDKFENDDEDKTFFYAIEGCSDLFAVTLVQDVEGNTKKIQYKMRLKEDGQYETVPESMEYVPMEEEVVTEVATREDMNKEFSVCDLIKQETYSNDHDLMLGDGGSNSSDSNSECKLRVDEHEEILQNFLEEQKEQENEENREVDPEGDNSEPFEEVFLSANEDSNSTDYVNVNSLPEDAAYEFLHEESDENEANAQGVEEYLNNYEENVSDVEDYQICEGVHVTADLIENEPKEVPYLCKSNESSQILKTHLQIDPNLNAVELKKDDKQFYFIVKCAEKENRTQIALDIPVDNKISKPNPRSLLKISQHETAKKEEKVVKNNTRYIVSKKVPKTQTVARHTVSHAPVRRERLPRKQTIKPAQRAEDEEIIVQEVVVSSNGFVQTSEGGVVKSKVPLKPSLIVNLSDSDEYEHERKKKKKNKKRKIPEIVITDSDDESCSENVVQIDLSRDSDGEKKEEKRKRGRPRKKPLIDPDDLVPTKKVKEPENEKDAEPKPTWQCLKCPKSFPSAGSLKTHTLHHNLQQSKLFGSTRQSMLPLTSKYECQTCKDRFKNKILLDNHIKMAHVEIPKKFVCNVCKKSFNDNLQLLVHKRAHVKEQMFKRTTLSSASPKQVIKTSPNKCDFCPKTFSTQILLKAHMRTHKFFTCATCTSRFLSKFALDNHVRNSCVKLKPKNIFKTPTKNLISTRPPASACSSSSSDSSRPKLATLKCDKCLIHFYSYKTLYNHKVIKHGVKTPDRNLVLQNSTKKNLLSRNVPEHSSVPASERLRLCYSGVRTNLYK